MLVENAKHSRRDEEGNQQARCQRLGEPRPGRPLSYRSLGLRIGASERPFAESPSVIGACLISPRPDPPRDIVSKRKRGFSSNSNRCSRRNHAAARGWLLLVGTIVSI